MRITISNSRFSGESNLLIENCFSEHRVLNLTTMATSLAKRRKKKEDEDTFLRKFIAYPNPSDGQFTVKIELEANADIRLRLVDIAGSTVDEREEKGSDRYEIYYDLRNKHRGVYFLQLSSGKVNTSLKLLLNSY